MLATWAVLAGYSMLLAQEAEVRTAPATTPAVAPAQAKSGEASKAAAAPAAAGDKKAEEKKPGEEGKPAEGEKGEAKDKKDEKVKPVQRPTEPKTPPDPKELKVRPDDQGLISFSFKNQPWPEVLEWLADISDLSLHWEEAPAGYLDLTTRGRYTPEEVGDLLNSVLLAKGFSVLRNGEILVVVNLKNLDASLVPRVLPDELDERGKYELVRVFFDLNSLVADDLEKEIKPMLSPYGKVTALKTTNRIDVLETAGNLRRIRGLIQEEQSDLGQARLLKEFKLLHTRADEVIETLNTLLGIKSTKTNNQPLTPQQQMMQQQQAMMLAQQQQQQGGKAAAPASKEPEVLLAVNSRENAILANAPPDKMSIIEQAIKAVDVPVGSSQSLLTNMPRLQIYRLSGVSPEALVKVLEDLGGLSPSTRLEVDTKNKAIIAYAPLVDHVMIQSLKDRLDGTGRKLEVIQLRMLRADYVAGSIDLLMNGPQENTQQRRSPFYFDYGFGRSSDTTEKPDKFQVDADVEHNRLLLRANDAELAEVRELLIKLGEIPQNGRNDSRMRVVPTLPEGDSQELLDRIRRIWPSLGDNPLEIETAPPVRKKPTGEHGGEKPSAERADETPPAKSRPLKGETAERAGGIQVLQLALQAPQDVTENEPAQQESDQQGPAGPGLQPRRDAGRAGEDFQEGGDPIRITVGPQGIILSSPDTEALDRLEELIGNLAPSRTGFRIFTLHHTYAKDVALLLEDVFKDGDEKKSTGTDFWERFYFGYSPSQSNQKARGTLSKRKPLSFVPDPVTNTILVQGADEQQLAEIERLIEIYDRVEPADSNSVRRQQMVTLEHAKARQVADTVKEVFRDLLSPNDKALATPANQQQQQQREQQQGFIPSLYSYLANANNESKENVPRFKGMLSVGVDELSNSVIVSAPQGLLSEVLAMIDHLEEAARPMRPVTHVFRLSQPGAASQLRDAFSPGGSRSSSRSNQTGGASGSQANGQQPNGTANGNGRRNGASRNGNRQVNVQVD